jgi:AAA15 family ATPase/GTPase
MIKELKITNFYSIYETQTLSFDILQKDMLDESSFISPYGNKLNSSIAVIGNNASGKTNVLRGLAFLLYAAHFSYIRMSVENSIPVEPHKAHKQSNSKFELIFENNGKEYQYKIELNSKTIDYEFLGVKNMRGYSAIYEIKRDGDNVLFLKWGLDKLNESDKERFIKRKNCSLFSFLLNTGHLPAKRITKIVEYTTDIGLSTRPMNEIYNTVLKDFRQNVDRKNKAFELVKNMGIGITAFNLIEADNAAVLNIEHKNDNAGFDISFSKESNGTQSIIYLLNKIVPIIENGGIVIYDEIESSIHPYIAKKIIDLFASKEINPKNSQILFSTHQPWLLNDRTKTQIYLVEKNANFESELYRLDEVEGVRNDDNFCMKYLAGAYGAVSDMRWF